MNSVEKYILKIKKKLSSSDIEERKILKYLRHLDELEVNVEILKSTGIGKFVNGLKKQEGIVGEAASNLVLKWKNAVTKEQVIQEDDDTSLQHSVNSPTKSSKSSLLNSTMDNEGHLQSRMHEREKERNRNEKRDKERMKNSDNIKPKAKAPSLQLCDISFGLELPVASKDITKPKKRHKLIASSSSSASSTTTRDNSNHRNKLTSSSFLPPLPSIGSVNEALLPDIQPTYKPSRLPFNLDDSPSKKKKGADIEGTYTGEIKSRKSRTQVFSGKKHPVTDATVSSLFDSCIRVLIENVEALHETGGVPYYLLHPVLVKCTAQQLLHLENCNPEYIEESDELWMGHYRREFKTGERADDLSWRESYLEKFEEREEKLAKINAKISASQAAKKPERQVKLAYLETVAKPPPQIRRKQARYGTAHGAVQIPIISPVKHTVKTSNHSRSSHTMIAPVQSASHASSAPPRRPASAPLLKKTMKLLKNQRSIAGAQIRRR